MTFLLPPVMDIAGASELKAHFDGLLAHQEAVELDGDQVERLDGAGLQLLVGFFQEAAVRQKAVTWENCSKELQATARLAGLDAHLKLA